MSRNFAQAPLMDFAPHIVDKTQGMLKKLNELSHDPVDVYHWLHRLGLEIIRAGEPLFFPFVLVLSKQENDQRG